MEKLLTLDEVAGILVVKKSTVYKWTHHRLIPYRKIGGLVRFTEEDLQRWLRSKQVKPQSLRRFSV